VSTVLHLPHFVTNDTKNKYIKLFTPVDISSLTEEDCCVICLEHLKVNNPIHLPCGHMYHMDCVLKWLEIKEDCPLGRCPIVPLGNIL